MDKVIRTVDQAKGVVQCTTVDERWYARPGIDPMTKLPTYDFVPSVTWICNSYPKGIGFYKWLANTGWDESQALKEAAGDKGSKVHYAIADLLDGKTVSMDAPYTNPRSGQPEPLTLEEYECLMGYAAWHRKMTPTIVVQNLVVWNEQERYAGTLDALATINGALWLIDFKTSQSVWPTHEIQVSAYRHTPEVQAVMDTRKLTEIKLAILQIGYKRNKAGYRFTPVEDQFDLFLSTKRIWAKETAGQSPAQKDYPMALTLAPAASATGKDAERGATEGEGNGQIGGGKVHDGVRKTGSGRMVGGDHRGSPVRRGTQV